MIREIEVTLLGLMWFLVTVALAVFAVTGADPVMHDGNASQCWPVWVCVLAGAIALLSISTLAVVAGRAVVGR